MDRISESIQTFEPMQTYNQQLMGQESNHIAEKIQNFDLELREVFTLLAHSVFDVRQAEVVHKVFMRMLKLFVAAGQAIGEKYQLLNDRLGNPVSAVRMGAGGGYYRQYEHGAIYWHPDTGAFEVSGAIYQKYLLLGAEAGFLGYPITDQSVALDGVGRYNNFQGGSIHWSPGTGAHETHGGIRDKWGSLGWEKSLLGYPTSDETATTDGEGRFNNFQNGSIYWTPITGAHEVHGAIRDTWKGLGLETSFLGYPTLDQKDDSSRFQRGTIQLKNGTMLIVPDVRVVNTGTIHLEGGTAANGWAELMIASTGAWQYEGSIRATGTLSYDVAIATAFNFKDSMGHGIAFAEEGDVEGTLVWGGNREHTWDKKGTDPFIRNNWEALQSAGLTTVLKVDFGAGDVLALVASILGLPFIALVIAAAGAEFDKHFKTCGRVGPEHYNPNTNKWEQDKSVVIVPKDQPCPPGTVG